MKFLSDHIIKRFLTTLFLIGHLNFIAGQQPSTEQQPTKNKVYFFIATSCPISQQYTHAINHYFEAYGNKFEMITFIGSRNNRKAKKEIKLFQQRFQYQMPIQLDIENSMAKQIGATINPEVFILSPQNEILYHGAIDNWFYALGKNRPKATEYYLEDAIQDILHQRSVLRKTTQAIGCFLEY